jgi:hypothetical protein
MLLRRLLPALLVLGVLAVALPGQEKDKGKAPAKGPEPAKDKDKAPAKGPEQSKEKGTAAKPPEQDKDPTKVTLRWKFEKDKPFYQTMTTETKQSMKVMNNDVNQTQKQTFYFSWTPVKEDKDGWQIKQRIEGVAMDIDIGGSKISYDSTKESQANNPLGDFFKALVGSEFTLTLNPKTMEVTKVEGRDKFIQSLTQANPQMKPLLDQILSDKALKEMAEPTFAVVPDQAESKSKGDKWTKKSTLEMGPIGRYDNEYTYIYEGKDEKSKQLDRIKVDTTLKYTPPTDASGTGGLPFRIKSADLKSTNATGTVLFDNTKGRVEESNMDLNLEGKLSIEIGGQTTEVQLSQTQKTTVKTSDDNPVKKK